MITALSAPGMALDDAWNHVPDRPGLYAIHAGADVWLELGLDTPADARPLYVGKAEDSLVTRDLKTHFGSGRTGSSTVRRSFAALLRKPLGLEAQPRNPMNPETFTSYGLPADADERLTNWMSLNLRLAVWPHQGSTALKDIEGVVIRSWLPPLNLQGVRTVWKPRVQSARSEMAAQARAWAQHHCDR